MLRKFLETVKVNNSGKKLPAFDDYDLDMEEPDCNIKTVVVGLETFRIIDKTYNPTVDRDQAVFEKIVSHRTHYYLYTGRSLKSLKVPVQQLEHGFTLVLPYTDITIRSIADAQFHSIEFPSAFCQYYNKLISSYFSIVVEDYPGYEKALNFSILTPCSGSVVRPSILDHEGNAIKHKFTLYKTILNILLYDADQGSIVKYSI